MRSVTISNGQNSVVQRTPFNKKGNSKRETYKSRNSEEEVDFDEKEVEQRQMQVKNEGPNKKQATKNNEESP